MFEAADRTVQKLWQNEIWWSEREGRGITEEHLAKWAALQCYGLSDAISGFHNFQKGDMDKSIKTKGLHCDIKPDNILHYEQWEVSTNWTPNDTVDEHLGVLQLNDFGLSTFHSTGSVDDKRIHGGFLEYAAPETEFLLNRNTASDVWHLGCFFMDFATWLVEGPKGYVKFRDERLTKGLRSKQCRFATFSPGKEPTYTNVTVNKRVLMVSEHRAAGRK
jgi:serine/threonine protein kinase